ncbi:hypothetical protein C1H46_008917 [Malus baccata]|uniref:Uncharacterized protein n=1 Tax=Malus baccata TaxID=106549 RepID=A0A540N378_MALBA|nr:hypothetical protein C1H46_008917 [Malus baccata]
MEELTCDPQVSLQLLMKGDDQRKVKKSYGLGKGQIRDLERTSSSSSHSPSRTSSRLQKLEMKVSSLKSDDVKIRT